MKMLFARILACASLAAIVAGWLALTVAWAYAFSYGWHYAQLQFAFAILGAR